MKMNGLRSRPVLILRLVACTWCFMAAVFVHAQPAESPTILYGRRNPNATKVEGDWYLDTLRLIAYRYNCGLHGECGWAPEETGGVEGILSCNDYIILRRDARYDVVRDRFHDKRHFDRFACGDSLLWAWSDFSLVAFGKKGINKKLFYQSFSTCLHSQISPQTIDQQLAFCVALPLDPWQFGNCKDIKAWGMMGLDGAWLIQPKFDAPFHFENGVAEVIYYGEKRKINEKGEFVE